MRRLMWLAAVAGASLLAPIVAAADDQDTAQQIADNLKGNLRNYSVQVKVQDGTAWLQGNVTDSKQMAAAEQIAYRTGGVQRVVNNLTIGSGTTNPSAGRSNLRQPNAVASGILGPNRPAVDESRIAAQPSQQARFYPVVPASAALPDHAQQQLQLANGPAPVINNYAVPADYETADPAAYNRAMPPRNVGMNPNGGQGNSMRPMSPPMPLALNAASPSPYRRTSSQTPDVAPESIDAPQPMPYAGPGGPGAPAPYHFDHPQMPGYAWPSYAAYPNYAAVTYPKQYSPTAWPYIGPFYPYPQVPLGWRKVSMEWKDGWWFLDFKDSH